MVLGEGEVAAFAAGDRDETLDCRIRERLEECGVDDREDRGRRGDANRERGIAVPDSQGERNTRRSPKRMS